MHFAIVTLFPEMFSALTQDGVIARGVSSGKLSLSFYSIREFSDNAHRRVDDQPYGGGPGMVMMAEPLALAIESAKRDLKEKLGEEALVVYLSPRGERFVQSHVKYFLEKKSWIFVCGRYEGVDQRLIDKLVDLEISIGDFVVSGGELPAMLMIDAIARHIPGVLGNVESALQESFMPESGSEFESNYDHSQYTRPRSWRGIEVPEVLLNGNHQKIKEWRKKAVKSPKSSSQV